MGFYCSGREGEEKKMDTHALLWVIDVPNLARARLTMYMRARAARTEDPRPSVVTNTVREGKASR